MTKDASSNNLTAEKIYSRFLLALRNFYKCDYFLVKNDVHERAMTHKLAEYLQLQFPDYDVDCEYNRVGEKRKEDYEKLDEEKKEMDSKNVDYIKRLNYCCSNCKNRDSCSKYEREVLNSKDDRHVAIYPDIIVHKRGKPINILVIEAKTWNARREQKCDCLKIQKLTETIEECYGYILGISFVFCKDIEKIDNFIKLYSKGEEKKF